MTIDPLQTDTANRLMAPLSAHWFGTDSVGRDVFSRVIVATRLDLSIAVSGVAFSFLIGSLLGCITGYGGGPAADPARAEYEMEYRRSGKHLC